LLKKNYLEVIEVIEVIKVTEVIIDKLSERIK